MAKANDLTRFIAAKPYPPGARKLPGFLLETGTQANT
jgi:hypothetical protein